MLSEKNGNGFYMPVVPQGGYGNGGFGFGGDGSWWVILFLFAMMGGWGNGFGGFGGGMAPYMMGANTNNDVQRGFDLRYQFPVRPAGIEHVPGAGMHRNGGCAFALGDAGDLHAVDAVPVPARAYLNGHGLIRSLDHGGDQFARQQRLGHEAAAFAV